MPMPISTKANKCFEHSLSFEKLQRTLPEKYVDVFAVSPEEECVGLYHNNPTNDELILITTTGIYLKSDIASRFVPYRCISQIDWLEPDKVKAASNPVLLLTLSDGEVVECPVRGSWYSKSLNIGGPDIANFHTFLIAVRNIRKILDSNEQGGRIIEHL